MLDIKTLSNSCVKCGKCIPSCTIYMANRDETTSPRGFLDLLGAVKRGDLDLDKNVKNIFESCFLCTTCVTQCPSSLSVDNAIESIRIDIARIYGIAWYKKAYFFLLRHRKAANFVFNMLGFIAPCAFKAHNNNSVDKKLTSRLKLFKNASGKHSKRSIFPFAKKSFLQTYSGLIEPKGQFIESAKTKNIKHKKVAIFIGCLSNYNYVNVGKSLLEILSTLGIKAFIPQAQQCCGAPAFFTGDIKTTLFLAKKNIDYFESFFDEIDCMLIPEATCAAMIKHDWKIALANDDVYKQKLESMLPKIAMASEWLYENTNLLDLLPESSLDSITYHDPCHARKVLGIHKEPRVLLQKSYKFIELKDSARCCGFGGISMQSDKYHLTLKAGEPKARDIQSSGAKIVSAECGACRMQLDNALSQIDSQVSFAHPLELITQALKANKAKF